MLVRLVEIIVVKIVLNSKCSWIKWYEDGNDNNIINGH